MTLQSSNLYEAIGGREGCHGLSTAFYARIANDPLLRPLFPGTTFKCAIEEFAAFLAQFLGGPAEDMQRRWWLSLRESHLRFKIGAKQRANWMANMTLALDDVHVEEPMRRQLLEFFERSSAHVVNEAEAPVVAAGFGVHEEIALRWEAQTTVDQAVAAIRRRDANRTVVLAESLIAKGYGQPLIPGLLAQMVRSGQNSLLDYVRLKLTNDPARAQERYAGRTLLHEAAAAGSLTMVQFLLALGADPNARDGGGHTPLYSLGNECTVDGAAEVVHALIEGGADVNARDGVKHCTALHMAARRDNVEVAGALLDCGADLEAQDKLGDTPLRRSVNCNQDGVAKLLLARGANPRSVGSKGLTPYLAARTVTMKRLLQSYG